MRSTQRLILRGWENQDQTLSYWDASELAGGYMGKILRVNLSTRNISVKDLEEDFARRYIGGVGTAARILYDEVPFRVDAFDPLNRLIFSTGPVTGTPVFSAGRHSVTTKSPLTGSIGDASAGGFWGAELKFSGYDMIVIHGRAEKPVYIWINDGSAEIMDARAYWGMSTRDADRAIRRDLGDSKARVATIGRAGESLVRYAAIMSDEGSRAAARCGVGAIMGFMNLKAVVARGHKSVSLHDEDRVKQYARELARILKADTHTQWFRNHGTPGYYSIIMELGDSPVENFRKGSFDGAEDLSLPGGYSKILVGTRTCYNCPVSCRRIVKVEDMPYRTDRNVEGPEYQTLAALGGNCGVSDVRAVAKANDLCNLYGIDTISAGVTVAFAMECYEKGILTKDDTEGLDLSFGNGSALVTTIEKIANREGFGNLLAEGSKRAAQIIGKGAERFAMEVKGLEVAMHDPRAFQAMGLTYATAPVGADHMEGETIFMENPGDITYAELNGGSKWGKIDRFSIEWKPEIAFKVQNLWAVIAAMGYCLAACVTGTTVYPLEYNIKFYEAVTGVKISFAEFMKAGERIYNVKRAFSAKHGFTSTDDYLPKRLLEQPMREGGSKGFVARVNDMLPEYYRLRGWDLETGKPTKEKLVELQLDDIANDLWT